MLKTNVKFVDSFQEIDMIVQDTLYISMQKRTVFHLCPCGCKNKVFLALGEEDWELIYNGKVTIYPSVGNFDFECQSHYYIIEDEIIPADLKTKVLFKKRFKQELKEKKPKSKIN